MSTTLAEFRRQVMLRFGGKPDGRTILIVDQAINDAHKIIAMVKDFDDLMVLDTANAATVANTSTYYLEVVANQANLSLTRPKDVYTIRYMDEENSRKLVFVPIAELDATLPYTLIRGTGRPTHYTRRGNQIEVFPVPDANKSFYVQHSRWPLTLANDTDESSFNNIDPVIVELAVDIASAANAGGGGGSWFERARLLLGITVSDETTRPDVWYIARPFDPTGERVSGEYWLNPWVKNQPR